MNINFFYSFLFNKQYTEFFNIKAKTFKFTNLKVLKKKQNITYLRKSLNFQGYFLKNFKNFNGNFKYLIAAGLKGDLEIFSNSKLLNLFKINRFLYSELNNVNNLLLYNKKKENNKILKNKYRRDLFFFRIFKLNFSSIFFDFGNLVKLKKKFFNFFDISLIYNKQILSKKSQKYTFFNYIKKNLNKKIDDIFLISNSTYSFLNFFYFFLIKKSFFFLNFQNVIKNFKFNFFFNFKNDFFFFDNFYFYFEKFFKNLNLFKILKKNLKLKINKKIKQKRKKKFLRKIIKIYKKSYYLYSTTKYSKMLKKYYTKFHFKNPAIYNEIILKKKNVFSFFKKRFIHFKIINFLNIYILKFAKFQKHFKNKYYSKKIKKIILNRYFKKNIKKQKKFWKLHKLLEIKKKKKLLKKKKIKKYFKNLEVLKKKKILIVYKYLNKGSKILNKKNIYTYFFSRKKNKLYRNRKKNYVLKKKELVLSKIKILKKKKIIKKIQLKRKIFFNFKFKIKKKNVFQKKKKIKKKYFKSLFKRFIKILFFRELRMYNNFFFKNQLKKEITKKIKIFEEKKFNKFLKYYYLNFVKKKILNFFSKHLNNKIQEINLNLLTEEGLEDFIKIFKYFNLIKIFKNFNKKYENFLNRQSYRISKYKLERKKNFLFFEVETRLKNKYKKKFVKKLTLLNINKFFFLTSKISNFIYLKKNKQIIFSKNHFKKYNNSLYNVLSKNFKTCFYFLKNKNKNKKISKNFYFFYLKKKLLKKYNFYKRKSIWCKLFKENLSELIQAKKPFLRKKKNIFFKKLRKKKQKKLKRNVIFFKLKKKFLNTKKKKRRNSNKPRYFEIKDKIREGKKKFYKIVLNLKNNKILRKKYKLVFINKKRIIIEKKKNNKKKKKYALKILKNLIKIFRNIDLFFSKDLKKLKNKLDSTLKKLKTLRKFQKKKRYIRLKVLKNNSLKIFSSKKFLNYYFLKLFKLKKIKSNSFFFMEKRTKKKKISKKKYSSHFLLKSYIFLYTKKMKLKQNIDFLKVNKNNTFFKSHVFGLQKYETFYSSLFYKKKNKLKKKSIFNFIKIKYKKKKNNMNNFFILNKNIKLKSFFFFNLKKKNETLFGFFEIYKKKFIFFYLKNFFKFLYFIIFMYYINNHKNNTDFINKKERKIIGRISKLSKVFDNLEILPIIFLSFLFIKSVLFLKYNKNKYFLEFKLNHLNNIYLKKKKKLYLNFFYDKTYFDFYKLKIKFEKKFSFIIKKNSILKKIYYTNFNKIKLFKFLKNYYFSLKNNFYLSYIFKQMYLNKNIIYLKKNINVLEKYDYDESLKLFFMNKIYTVLKKNRKLKKIFFFDFLFFFNK